MKRTIIMTLLSFFVILIFVQGIFVFAFSGQYEDTYLAFNNPSGNYKVGFANIFDVRTVQKIKDRLVKLDSTLNPDILCDISEIGYSVHFIVFDPQFNQYSYYFFFDEVLTSRILHISLPVDSAIISHDYASINGFSNGSLLHVFGKNYTIYSMLSLSQLNKLNAYYLGKDTYVASLKTGNRLSNVIVLNIDTLYQFNSSLELHGGFFECFASFYYSSKSFDLSKPLKCLKLSEKVDSNILLNLGYLNSLDQPYLIYSVLTHDLHYLIENKFPSQFLQYMLFSSPLIFVLLYFTKIVMNSTKRYWLKQLRRLWEKGFSRKQSFHLLVSVYLVVDIVVLLASLFAIFIELMLLGVMSGKIFLLSTSFFLISFILLILIQLRELFLVCYPIEEYLSLYASAYYDFDQDIRGLEKSVVKKQKLSISATIKYLFCFSIGLAAINFSNIFFKVLKSRLGFVISFLNFSSIFVALGWLVVSISLLSLFLKYLLPFLFHILSHFIIFISSYKFSLNLFKRLFYRSLLRYRKLGTLLFFLFLVFSFSWLIGNVLLFEMNYESYNQGPFDVEILPQNCYEANLTDTLNEILMLSSVSYYSPIFIFEGVNVNCASFTYKSEVYFLNATVFSNFLLSAGITDKVFAYNSLHEAFKLLSDSDVNASIAGLSVAMSLKIALKSNVQLNYVSTNVSFSLNTTVVDIAKYNIIRPRWYDTNFLAFSLKSLPLSLPISASSVIMIKLTDSADVNSFVEKLYNVYNLPLSAIIYTSKSPSVYIFSAFLYYLEIFAFLSTIFICIPLFNNILYSSNIYLASLYSRGYVFKKILNIEFAFLLIYYILYAGLGLLFSSVLFLLTKTSFANMFYEYKTYFAFYVNLKTVVCILGTSTLSILLPFIVIKILFAREQYLRSKAVSTLILTDKSLKLAGE